ncbi:MAG: phosphoribosylanthranilate isomerase [Candidatus Nitrospinota bacterium M3_3B_026]
MAGLKVKICGQTSIEGCEASVRHGADFLGVVLDVEWSPRSLSADAAMPIFERFRDRAFLLLFDRAAGDTGLLRDIEKLKPFALQLTGRETPQTAAEMKAETGARVFKSVHLRPAGEGEDDPAAILRLMEGYAAAGVDGFVLDTAAKGMFGGTGLRCDWDAAAKIVKEAPRPVFLAGGINPANAAEAAKVPGIYGIDLASGVESAPGVKSEEKIRALFETLRLAGAVS